ncbi:MAG: hypothetical protein RTU30_01060 [Candidatus Thorarchaeota archaeon]
MSEEELDKLAEGFREHMEKKRRTRESELPEMSREDLEDVSETIASCIRAKRIAREVDAKHRRERVEAGGAIESDTQTDTEQLSKGIVDESKEKHGKSSETDVQEVFQEVRERLLQRIESDDETKEALNDSSPKRMEQSNVDEVLSKLEDTTPESMAKALEELHKKHASNEANVYYADISKHKTFEEALSRHQEEVEDTLKERLDLKQPDNEMRLGVADGRAYLRETDPNPTRLENAYADLYHYFRDKETFDDYIDDIGKSIGIEDQDDVLKHMRKLAPQMISEPTSDYCINPKLSRIRGDHLDLMNDLSGMSLSDIEEKISKLTGRNGHGGINEPLYPSGEKLENANARMTATFLSDATIEPNGVIKYAEPEMDRIKRVVDNVRVFGDINPSSTRRQGENHYITHFPFVIGKYLMAQDVPTGDRTIQNPGLHPRITEGSIETKRAYLEDLIPQEGCIGKRTMIWHRASALHAGNKSERYGFESTIDVEEQTLIKEHGRKETANAASWALSWGKLEELTKHPEDKTAEIARNLEQVVRDNPNRLINDETGIMQDLGIKVKVKPSDLRYYPETGRVTAIWQARTVGLKETIKLGIIAPSNDSEKRRKAEEMINGYPEERRTALRELSKRNIRF